jgi:hypothetical protein
MQKIKIKKIVSIKIVTIEAMDLPPLRFQEKGTMSFHLGKN